MRVLHGEHNANREGGNYPFFELSSEDVQSSKKFVFMNSAIVFLFCYCKGVLFRKFMLCPLGLKILSLIERGSQVCMKFVSLFVV